MDPLNVACCNCGSSQDVAVAELLAKSAFCPCCGASLREIGERLHHTLDELQVECELLQVVMDLEDEFAIRVSNEEIAMLTKGVTTKGEFVNAYLALRLPDADRETIGAIFDRSIGLKRTVPLPDSFSLLQLLEPTRFAERVAHYRPASR